MSLIDGVIAGNPYDASSELTSNPVGQSPLFGVLAGDAPDVLQSQASGVQVSFTGSAFIAVPGPPGGNGRNGIDGSVAGTLPYAQVTGKPLVQTDLFTVRTPGVQTLHLTYSPQNSSIYLYLNGAFQADISDVQISGAVISIPASWPLSSPDLLAVQYGYLP